jgi:hypothetical protein
VKIIDIRESTRPIRSNIRNAYIDFSKMTLSLVAVVADVIRDGKPVIGYGFNSNGRLGLGGNESYPDLFQPYGGFPDDVRVDNGFVTLPDLPGIGFEGKADLYREMTALAG